MIKTLKLQKTDSDIKKAAHIIKKGGIVAFPTETVYGLGANGLDAVAAKRIYEAKGRPSDNPMILHIADISAIYDLAEDINDVEIKLAEMFWPGPLTIVFKRKPCVPDVTTGGLDTVGIRMPDNETARRLIREAEVAIAAPSANTSGKPSPTRPEHVLNDLDGRIDAIIYGGMCEVGVESTVVLAKEDEIVILRPGKITREELQNATGVKVSVDKAIAIELASANGNKDIGCHVANERDDVDDSDFKPMAPGMKYKHYAPDAQMIVFRGEEDKVKEAIGEKRESLEADGKKVGVIFFGNDNQEVAAHELFDRLREMDKNEVEVILAGAVNEDGIGYAVMNRLLKSAGYNVLDV